MASKVQVTMIDDLDGESEAVETVSFGLDNDQLEIDLNAKNAKALRSVLAKYVEHARKASRGSNVTPIRRSRQRASGVPTQEVREWAKANNIEVKERGRIPAEVVKAYQDAQAS